MQLIFDMTYNLQQELFGCEAQEVSSYICQKYEFELSRNIDNAETTHPQRSNLYYAVTN